MALARKLAGEARQKLLEGVDPLDERKAEAIIEQDAEQVEKGNARTFKECAKALIESKQGGWKNEKHRAQWRGTLEVYAYPHIGHLPVAEIDTSHVLEVLQQQVPLERRRKRGAGGLKKASLWERGPRRQRG